jgi:hypothetical protein
MGFKEVDREQILPVMKKQFHRMQSQIAAFAIQKITKKQARRLVTIPFRKTLPIFDILAAL